MNRIKELLMAVAYGILALAFIWACAIGYGQPAKPKGNPNFQQRIEVLPDETLNIGNVKIQIVRDKISGKWYLIGTTTAGIAIEELNYSGVQ